MAARPLGARVPARVIRVIKPGDSLAARADSQRGHAGADDSHLEASDSRPGIDRPRRDAADSHFATSDPTLAIRAARQAIRPGIDKPRRDAADSHSAASDPTPAIRASRQAIRTPKSVIRLLKAAIRPVATAIPTLIRNFFDFKSL